MSTNHAVETVEERKNRIVKLTIKNLLDEAGDKPLRLSADTVNADEYLAAAVMKLQTEETFVSVERTEDTVTIARILF